MQTRHLFSLAALAVLSLFGSGVARADQTAVAFLQPYVQWAQSQANGPGTYGLDVKLVSNQTSQVVSYAENGFLSFGQSWVITKYFIYHDTYFSGNSTQYFNDRRFALGSPFASDPFNPLATDSLGIFLDANTGSVTLTLNSWGGGKLTGDLHAANGLLYGEVYPTSGQPCMVVLSVRQLFQPIIR